MNDVMAVFLMAAIIGIGLANLVGVMCVIHIVVNIDKRATSRREK